MQALPPKKEVALALLQRSSMFIHLDPRSDAVRVPPWFKKQAQLVLQVGLNMAVPIRDLEVDDEAISCTLSFSRTPHFCFMPFSAIYALVGEDGRGMVWPDDVPPEVAAQANTAGTPQQSPRKRSHLRAVSDDEQPAEESADAMSDGDDAGPDTPAKDAAAESTSPSAAEEAVRGSGPKRGGLRSVPAAEREVPDPVAQQAAASLDRAALAQAEPDVAPAGGESIGAEAAENPGEAGPADDSRGGEPAAIKPAQADADSSATPSKSASVEPKSDPAEVPAEGEHGKRKLPPYLRIVK